jgi:hypothetical protein
MLITTSRINSSDVLSQNSRYFVYYVYTFIYHSHLCELLNLPNGHEPGTTPPSSGLDQQNIFHSKNQGRLQLKMI